MILSKRLLSAVKYVKDFNCLADCGTDHGLFPIFAIDKDFVKKAIASDNKEQPLKNAKENIKQYGFENEIETILADGLSYLNPNIDVVSILGMGGILISEILDKADLASVKRLVLSPNSEAYTLRKWLMDNDFKIQDEEMVKDRNKFYQIMIAERGKMFLNEIELEFGKILIDKKDKLLAEKINREINKLKKALKLAKTTDSKTKITNRLNILEEVLK